MSMCDNNPSPFYTYAEVVKLQMQEACVRLPLIIAPFMVKGRMVRPPSPQEAVSLLPRRYRSAPVFIWGQ